MKSRTRTSPNKNNLCIITPIYNIYLIVLKIFPAHLQKKELPREFFISTQLELVIKFCTVIVTMIRSILVLAREAIVSRQADIFSQHVISRCHLPLAISQMTELLEIQSYMAQDMIHRNRTNKAAITGMITVIPHNHNMTFRNNYRCRSSIFHLTRFIGVRFI